MEREMPLRRGFHQVLEEIDAKVIQIFALVGEGLAAATDTFLAGERGSPREAKERDDLIDSLYADVERIVEHQLLFQAPVAGEFRYLLSVLRIVPELERSGDLAEHISVRAFRGLGGEVTPTLRGIIEQMGRISLAMWRAAADAYAERDGEAAIRLDEADDELDELQKLLMAELNVGELPTSVAIEMALVGRFYERLGDHALHVTERVRYAVLGRPRDV